MKLGLLAFVVLIAGCAFGESPAQQAPATQSPAQQQSTTTPPSAAAENAVYQAVARYQITTWQLGAHAYCFRVKGQDADKVFGAYLGTLESLTERLNQPSHKKSRKPAKKKK